MTSPHTLLLPRLLRRTALILPLILGLTCTAPAAVLEELSPADRAKLESGGKVMTVVEVEGATWPEIKIYRKVKATPQGITDLFLDYENANTFIENLDSAKVENQPDPDTKDVRYTVRLPVLFTVSYLVRNHYVKTPNGYTVEWDLLESMLAKSAKGALRVEPLGDGSVICYANHVEPATSMVAGLRGLAIKEASKTVDAIVKEAERRHAANPPAPQP